MAQRTQNAIIFITADQLTEGEIVNYNNDILLIASESEYITAGITFDAMYLEVLSATQTLSIAPDTRIELINHQPSVTQIAA